VKRGGCYDDRVRAIWLLPIALASCQWLLVFTREGGESGGSPDGAAELDADLARDGGLADSVDSARDDGGQVARPLCNHDAAFLEPVPLTKLNTPENESSLWLTEDETSGVLSRGTQFRYVERSTTSELMEGAAFDVTLANATYKARPFLYDDKFFFHAIISGGKLDIFVATLGPGGAYGASALDGSANTGADEADPCIGPSGTLYFASPRAIDWRIYEISDASAARRALASTNGPEKSPIVSNDELTLYFGLGMNGDAQYDIYRATRTSRTQQFDAPVALGPSINRADATEWPRWVSSDDCVLYFVRQEGGSQGEELYRAARPKP
jgi:hypothetical protein